MVGQLIKIYMLSLRKKAEQTRIFSIALTQEVMHKVRDMIDTTNVSFKKITTQGKQADKDLEKIK